MSAPNQIYCKPKLKQVDCTVLKSDKTVTVTESSDYILKLL